MTLQDVINKWKLIADRTTYDMMKEEIVTFIEEAKEAGATFGDLARRKEHIILIWSPTSWKKAQEEFPHWHNRDWYEKRHKWIINLFGKTIKSVYTEELQAMKTTGNEAPPAQRQAAASTANHVGATSAVKLSVVPQMSTQAEDDYYSQFEVFTTHQQVLDHTKEYQEKLRKELAQ
jgi:hypothetical protein